MRRRQREAAVSLCGVTCTPPPERRALIGEKWTPVLDVICTYVARSKSIRTRASHPKKDACPHQLIALGCMISRGCKSLLQWKYGQPDGGLVSSSQHGKSSKKHKGPCRIFRQKEPKQRFLGGRQHREDVEVNCWRREETEKRELWSSGEKGRELVFDQRELVEMARFDRAEELVAEVELQAQYLYSLLRHLRLGILHAALGHLGLWFRSPGDRTKAYGSSGSSVSDKQSEQDNPCERGIQEPASRTRGMKWRNSRNRLVLWFRGDKRAMRANEQTKPIGEDIERPTQEAEASRTGSSTLPRLRDAASPRSPRVPSPPPPPDSRDRQAGVDISLDLLQMEAAKRSSQW
ncbi:hypothetical protein OPV22_023056 [Ensete ventricosum]|uniref:Uncharacterized protein n=1 Tax=Ensete ventricosum TaxID=4639 RepID=A0AAV8QH11_ENSVE|nr:hypothetical protein OPV22_023056 [Ensete ventricosum]